MPEQRQKEKTIMFGSCCTQQVGFPDNGKKTNLKK
jgi:hypothetical protein